ncbi:MAG: HEAT repeat domain-containing protein [bacterium]
MTKSGAPTPAEIEQRLLDLASELPQVNGTAQEWFLGRGAAIAPMLAEALNDKRLGSVAHWRILLLLRELRVESTLPAVLAALRSGDPIARPGAMEALAVFPGEQATEALTALLDDPDADVVRHARALLRQMVQRRAAADVSDATARPAP